MTIITVVVIFGIIFIIYTFVVKRSSTPTPATGGTIPPRPEAEVGQDINSSLDNFAAAVQAVADFHLNDPELCREAVKLAEKLYNLLKEYHNLPNSSPAVYAAKKQEFNDKRMVLSNLCGDTYSPSDHDDLP